MRAKKDHVKPTLTKQAVACLVNAAMVATFTPMVAWGEPNTSDVKYLDWNTTSKKLEQHVLAENYTEINSNYLATLAENGYKLKAGWYVARDDVIVSQRIKVHGHVQLILADDCDLTVNGGIQVQDDNGNPNDGSDNSLTIYGQTNGTGSLSATGSGSNAGIGGTSSSSNSDFPAGSITINGGNITANGGSGQMGTGGAGIGGANGGSGGIVTINGGVVNATGSGTGAGIGGGSSASGGTIEIAGGTVAASGTTGAGIGGGGVASGTGGAGGTITISGGTVTANSTYGAGIGGGCGVVSNGDSGIFSTGTTGNAVIFASSISDTREKDSNLWSGVIFEGNEGKVYGSSVTPAYDFTIPADKTLTIDNDKELTIPADVTVTNDGTINVDGTLVNFGTITKTPSIVGGSYFVVAPPTAKGGLTYNGNPQQLIAAPGTTSGSKLQYLNGNDWADDYTQIVAVSAGTHDVCYRLCRTYGNPAALGSVQTLRVTIAKAAPSLGITASEGSVSGGGAVTLTVSGALAGEKPLVACDNGIAVTSNSDGTYTATLPNETKDYTFTASYTDDNNHSASSATCTVSVTRYVPYVPPTYDVPAAGEGGIAVRVTVSGSTAVLGEISASALESAAGSGAATVTIDLSGLPKGTTQAQLSKSTVDKLLAVVNDTGNAVESVTMNLGGAVLTIDAKALAAISEQAKGASVTLGVTAGSADSLSVVQQQALSPFEVVELYFEAQVKCGGAEVHDFGGGSVSVSVAFEPLPGHDPARYVVLYVGEDGSIERYSTAWADGLLSFMAPHFSAYAVVYVEDATQAAIEALEVLPVAGKLKTNQAKKSVNRAESALGMVAALDDGQKMLVDEALVANAQEVVVSGNALVAKADKKAAAKVRDKGFSVKAGASKSIYFKTKLSAAGTKVTYKKSSGSKYITVTKSGKVTAKKGMRAGKTYTAKVKVTCGKAVEHVKVAVRAR